LIYLAMARCRELCSLLLARRELDDAFRLLKAKTG